MLIQGNAAWLFFLVSWQSTTFLKRSTKILPLYQKNKTFQIQELKKLLELILYPRNKQLCDKSVCESVINSLIRK